MGYGYSIVMVMVMVRVRVRVWVRVFTLLPARAHGASHVMLLGGVRG